MGYQAGYSGQGTNAVAIGFNAGQTNQWNYCVAIGTEAGAWSQGGHSIAIGYQAGWTNSGSYSVSLGYQAGYSFSGDYSVFLGFQAGYTGSGNQAIAIGYNAGTTNQGNNAIAIGQNAGGSGQGTNAVAIGTNAGFTNQGTNAIAIGNQAGQTNQGENSIVIGYNASVTNLKANCIVINGTATAIGRTTGDTRAAGTFINPVRGQNSGTTSTIRVAYFNTDTKELGYDAQVSQKTFVIDHPDFNDRYLVHACLEGPESGVYYRGKGEIINNESVRIFLPDYTKNLATDFTIQLTQIYSGQKIVSPLQSTEIENGSFVVYGNNTKFHWLVQGKRSEIVVEPLKSSTNVKGDGPYRWI